MSGDAFFRHFVHFVGANLYFKGLAFLRNNGCMQRLVQVRAGHGDEVLDPARNRAPEVVDYPQNRVTVLQ